MWIAGTIALMFVACLLGLLLAGRLPPEEKRPIWDIPRVAATYTSIVGTLAGFSVASSFFLANLSYNTNAAELETVIGMLIIAFLTLVGTAMTYGSTPNFAGSPVDEKFATVQRLVLLLGHISYYIGIALAWLSLLPLMKALGLLGFGEILTWLLLFVVVAGAGRMSMYFHGLIGGNRLLATFMPVTGIGLASLYRLVLVPILPGLWPASAPSLSYAVVSFVLVAVTFVSSSFFIHTLATPAEMPKVRRRGERFVLFLMQAVCCSIALLWYSVAWP